MRTLISFLVFILLFCNTLNSFSQTLITFAGNGTQGFSGDGGIATNAQIFCPTNVTGDNKGNIYIADGNSSVIRKVDAAGIISTIAGNNVPGYTGDGGPASAAQINDPYSICFDNIGNMYFSDIGANVIRKIDLNGIITTIAGNGTAGFSGDGGPALQAQLQEPAGICIDNTGNLYFCDLANQKIRKVDKNGVISTFAGAGFFSYEGYSGDGGPATAALLNSPGSISISPSSGEIYFSDIGNFAIRKIDKNGIITTVAGTGVMGYSGDGGPASAAQFNDVETIVFDQNNNLYLADLTNAAIRKIDASGIVTTIAGNGTYAPDFIDNHLPPTQTALGSPFGVFADNKGNIYFSDFDQQVIREITNCINPQIILQPRDTSVCTGSDAGFTIIGDNIPYGYQWLIDSGSGFTWITDNGVLVNSNSNTLTVKNVTAAMNNYRFECAVDYQNVCGSNNLTTTIYSQPASLSVITNTSPNPESVVNTSANNICSSSPITYTLSAQTNATILSYQWQLNGLNTGANSSTYINNHPEDGDKVNCIVTTNTIGCSSPYIYSDTSIMSVATNPVITLSPTDTTLNAGETITMNTVISGNYNSYSWTPTTGLSNPYSLQPTTIPLTTNSTYQLNVSYGNNCSVSKSVIINVKNPIIGIFIPNSFTPNGDGINDVFRIPPGITFNLSELSIYDRWGNKVFSTNNINTGWDGSFNGTKCAPGSYIYIITGSDATAKKTMKGNLLLLR